MMVVDDLLMGDGTLGEPGVCCEKKACCRMGDTDDCLRGVGTRGVDAGGSTMFTIGCCGGGVGEAGFVTIVG